MCGPKKSSASKDNSAEIARQEEAARQARIKAGESNIDQAFSQAFSPDYFSNYQATYEGAATPDLTSQYQDARKKLTLALSRTGNLTSSSGASRFGDLEEKHKGAAATIRDRAMSAVNDLKSRVEQQRTDLYNLNRASADPSKAATMAASALQPLQTGPQVAPLENVFASLLNSANTGLMMESTGRYPGLKTGLFNATGTNSGSVVS